MPSVSLLIPTMNRPEALSRTLQTLLAGDDIPEQIVVVDQSADPDVAESNRLLLQSVASAVRDTVYVRMDSPSLTGARNAAVERARGDVVIFSDDDVDVEEGTIRAVRRYFSDEGVALVAAVDVCTPPSKNAVGYLLGTKSYRKRCIGHVTSSMLGRYPDQVTGAVKTEWAMGYFFAVRRDLLQKWGICWDERLTGYAYAEDLDFSYLYCRKAEEEGLRCLYCGDVRVAHLVSREYRIPSREHTVKYVVNRAYIAHKNKFGVKARLGMGWCNFWMLLYKTVKKERPGDMLYAIRVKNRIRRSGFRTLE